MPTTPGGFCSLGKTRDLRDAQAVLYALKAADLVRKDNASANKQAREAISHYWQYPRIPAAHFVDGQYPESVLWTPKAKAIWDGLPVNTRGKKTRHKGKSVGVRLEHLVPQRLVREELLDNINELDAASLAEKLTEHHQLAWMVVVTKEEDDKLNQAGLRSATEDALQPWNRYSVLGITQADCIIINPTACSCVDDEEEQA